MRVGLVGFFGWGNFGDELFFDIWQQALAQHELIRMNDLIEKPYFLKSAHHKAASVDAILIGGGDLIRSEAISPLYWNGAWVEKPIVVSGIGVAEESKKPRADVIPRLQTFFRSKNVLSVSVRDESSAAWIRQNLNPGVAVRTVPDLVFSSQKVIAFGNEAQKNKIPKVGFVLNKTQITEEDMKWWNRLLRAHRERKIIAQILVLATGDQREKELENLRKNGLEEFSLEFESTDQMLKCMRGMDLLVSAKFHALVVASEYEIPYVSLRETSKSIAFARYSPSVSPREDIRFLLDSTPVLKHALSRESFVSSRHISDLARSEVSLVTEIMNTIDKIKYS